MDNEREAPSLETPFAKTGTRRGESPRLLFGAFALLSCALLLASPIVLGGCVFKLGPINAAPCDGAEVHVVAGEDIDLSKVTCIRVVVTGAVSSERTIPKPAEGWPNEVRQKICFTSGAVEVAITAYDGAGLLVGLGAGKTVKDSAMSIELRSTVPWS